MRLNKTGKIDEKNLARTCGVVKKLGGVALFP
jgi:hypothetical protein